MCVAPAALFRRINGVRGSCGSVLQQGIGIRPPNAHNVPRLPLTDTPWVAAHRTGNKDLTCGPFITDCRPVLPHCMPPAPHRLPRPGPGYRRRRQDRGLICQPLCIDGSAPPHHHTAPPLTHCIGTVQVAVRQHVHPQVGTAGQRSRPRQDVIWAHLVRDAKVMSM